MQRKILKNQDGMVLFVVLIFGILLAAMTVTTSQVTSFATKYSTVNDTYIRSYAQQVSMENDIDYYIGAMIGKNPIPGTTGGTANILIGTLQGNAENMDSDPVIVQELYQEINESGSSPTGGFDSQFGDHLKCVNPASGEKDFDFSHPSGPAVANIAGFCKIDVNLDPDAGLNVVDGRFNRIDSSGKSLKLDVPSTWQTFDWQDEDCSDLPGYGEMSCFHPYSIGQNFTTLKTRAENLYMKDYSSASRYQDAKNYANALPQAMVEIAEPSNNLGNAMLAAGGYSAATTEYYVRLTTVGYAGYDKDSNTVLSAKAVSAVKKIQAK